MRNRPHRPAAITPPGSGHAARTSRDGHGLATPTIEVHRRDSKGESCNRRGRYHVPHVLVPELAEANHRHASDRTSKRPAHFADVAQARLFKAILTSELVEIDVMSEELEMKCAADADESLVDELLRMNDRAKEVRQLIDALGDRFGRL